MKLTFRIAIWLAAVLFGVSALLLFAIHTPPGLRLIRATLLSAANPALAGELRVGGFEGLWVDAFTLKDLELTDASGEVFAAADSVYIDYSFWSLLFGSISVDQVVLKGGRVSFHRFPDGSFAPIGAPGDEDDDEDEDGKPPATPIPISVASVEADVSRLEWVEVDRPGEGGAGPTETSTRSSVRQVLATVDDIALSGTYRFRGDVMQAELHALRGEVKAPTPGPLGLSGAYALRSGLHQLTVSATVAEARAQTRALEWRPGDLPQGSVSVDIPPEFIGAWTGDPKLRLPLDLQALGAESQTRTGVRRLDVSGSVGGGNVQITAEGDPAFLEILTDIQDLAIHRITSELPKVTISASGFSSIRPERETARLNWTASATVGPGPRFQRETPIQARIDAKLDDEGTVSGEIELRSKPAFIDVEGTVKSALTDPIVQSLNGAVRIRSLESIPLPQKPSGSIELEGSYEARSWIASVRGDSLQLASVTVGRVSMSGRGIGDDIDADGVFEDLEVSNVELGTVRFDVDPVPGRRIQATVTSTRGGALRSVALRGTSNLKLPFRVDLADGRIETERAEWTIDPWTLRVTGRDIVVEGFRASSFAGYARADGRVRVPAYTNGTLDVGVRVKDLSVFSPFWPELEAGRFSFETKAEWSDAQRSLRSELRSRVRLGTVGRPVSVNAKAAIEASRAEAEAEVRSAGLGRVRLDAAGSVDGVRLRDLGKDPRALTRRIETADLRAEKLDLRFWADLFGLKVVRSGHVDGRLRYRSEIPLLDGVVDGDEIWFEEARHPLSLRVRVSGGVQGTQVAARVVGPEEGEIISADVRLRDSVHRMFELEPLSGSAELLVEDLSMQRVSNLFELPEPFDTAASGRLDVAASARFGGRTVGALQLTARDVEVYPAAPPINVALESRLDSVWTGTATVGGTGFGEVRVWVESPEPPWKQPVPAEAHVKLEEVLVTGIRAFVDVPVLVRGQLSGSLDWTDQLERGSGEFRLRRAAVYSNQPPFEADGRISVTPEDATIRVEAGLDERRPIEADVFLKRRSSDWTELSSFPVDGTLKTEALDLKKLVSTRHVARFDGRLNASARLEGTLSEPVARARLDVEGGRFGGTEFEVFSASGEFQNEQLVVNATVTEKEHGSLVLISDSHPDDLSARIEAQAFDLEFLAAPLAVLVGPVAGFGGLLSGVVIAEGTPDQPDLKGDLHVEDLQILLPWAVPSVEGAALDFAFEGPEFDLNLEGGSGPEGRFRLTGGGRLGAGGQASAELKTEKVRYLAGPVVTEITSDVSAELKGRNLAVTVHESSVYLPEGENAENLHALDELPDIVEVETFGVRPRPATVVLPSPNEEPDLTIRVNNDETVRFRGIDAQGTASVDITAAVFGTVTKVDGSAQINSGRISVFGNEYRVEKAVVRLTGDVPPDPRVDIQLAHDFRTLTLYVYVTGSVSDPTVRFQSSSGEYGQAELVGFFTGLTNPDDGTQAAGPEPSRAETAGNLILGPAIRQVRQALPIDTLEVAARGNAAVVTVGKWISESIFVAAGYDGSESGADAYEGTVRWQFAPSWILEVITSLNTQSGDLLWTKRF
ncbi:MAG: translocation/assembly module TamB domain-containing protein [Myxococcota bacterium]